VLACVVCAYVFRATIFAALGGYLVQAGPPEKCDIAVVLAGDASGNRIVKAADLVRAGYAPRVLVSGPAGNYGLYETELAIPFAEKSGYPASYFVAFPNHSHSTKDEGEAVVAQLRSLGAHRVLLVTSDFHTRRAGKIFRATMPDIDFDVVGSTDPHFTPMGWWRDREGRKTFVIEWMKTVSAWFGA
jgi:uncharacterized SAM-binding protein YcdF (DUF218 family)